MQAVAHANYVRYAPRKVNQVLSLVRRKSVIEALRILSFLNKKPSILVAKTIKSAVANAGDTEAKDPKYKVHAAWVGQGPVLKRMRAFAMGRGAQYKRKTCHLTVVVSDGDDQQKSKRSAE